MTRFVGYQNLYEIEKTKMEAATAVVLSEVEAIASLVGWQEVEALSTMGSQRWRRRR